MKKCRNCEFWSKYDRECYKFDWLDDGENPPQNGAALYAYALDDSGLDVRFKTDAGFSCIQFSEKKGDKND